jgi:SAM-dependent methyltransferase
MSLKERLERLLPKDAVTLYRAYRNSRGGHERKCPICSYQGHFLPFGKPLRMDAMCGKCGSLERHRLLWLWLQGHEVQTPLVHFAPEPILEQRFRKQFSDYRTADMFMPGVDLKLDIEAIDLPDNSVRTVMCHHVLEHVDDRRALSEMFRVIAPGGSLVCSVPIVEGWEETYEPPAIQDPAARELHFGQSDHVRYYGRDFRDRVKAAGFELAEFTANGPDSVQFALLRGDKLFIGRKAA